MGDDDQKGFAEMMMDYLPNALVFVFVINVAAAGGLQKDRVSSLLYFTVINITHYPNINNLLHYYACGYSADEHNVHVESW